jgi:hypothetical protein
MPDYPDTHSIGPGDDVLTRDLSSGRIHRRIRIGDNLASIEADNLDDAGEFEVITADQLADVEPGGLCERCFPPVPADPDAA